MQWVACLLISAKIIANIFTYLCTYIFTYPPTHLSTYLLTYPWNHLPITYLLAYLPIHQLTHQSTSTHLPTYLLHTFPNTHLPTTYYIPSHAPTYLPTYPQHQNVAFTLQKSSHMCHLWLELTTWLPSPNDHVVNPTSHISPNHINDYSLPWL